MRAPETHPPRILLAHQALLSPPLRLDTPGHLSGEIEEQTDEDGKNKAAQALGQGGGKAQAEKMRSERR